MKWSLFYCRRVCALVSTMLVLQLLLANMIYACGICTLGKMCQAASLKLHPHNIVQNVNTQNTASTVVASQVLKVFEFGKAEPDVSCNGLLCEQCTDYSTAHLLALTTLIDLPALVPSENTRINYDIAFSDFLRISDTPPP